MLKLHYTKEQASHNLLLRDLAITLVLLGAKHEDDCLCYDGDVTVNPELFEFVESYTCFVVMGQDKRDRDVFEGLPNREITGEGGSAIISFDSWKRIDFEMPLLHKGFYYMPNDMNTKEGFTGKDLQIFKNNGCEIMSIDQYREMLESFVPRDFNGLLQNSNIKETHTE